MSQITRYCKITITTVLQPFFRDTPGELVPEENFWTLWCKGRLTEADKPTIRLDATPSGLTSPDLHHPPFFTGRMPFPPPINSVKALKATTVINTRQKQVSESLLHTSREAYSTVVVKYH